MTPDKLAEIKARYPPGFVVSDLVAEVERCWEGLRTGAVERARLRAVLEKAYDAALHGDLHTVQQLLIEEVEG